MGLFAIVFIAFANNVNAYQEQYLIVNDFVDGNKDEFYQSVYNSTDNIYFAKSEKRYALFIESNETIQRLAVNSTVLTSNFEDGNLIAKFSNKSVEFVVFAEHFGDPLFGIQVNNHSRINLDPTGMLIPKPPSNNTQNNNNQTANEGWDLVEPLNKFFSSGVTWFIIALILVFVMDYKRHPIIYVLKNGKEYKLGKYIASFHNETLNRWENWFATAWDGISIYYSDYEFSNYSQFYFKTYYQIEHLYPFLRLIDLDINIEVEKRTLIKGKSRFLKFISALFVYTPAKFIVRHCYKNMKANVEKTKTIQFLTPDIMMKSLEYKFKAKWNVNELDSNSNEYIPVEKTKSNLLYSDILALQKSNVNDLVIEFQDVEIKHYRTIDEAEKDKRSRDEIFNTDQKTILDLENENLSLQERNQLLLNQISNLKREFNTSLYDELSKLKDVMSNSGRDLIEILKEQDVFRKMGFDEEDSLRESLKKFAEKSLVDYQKIREENAELKGRLDGLGIKLQNEKKQSFKPNVIEINEGVNSN